MFNAGQCCCGIERFYVHDRRYDAFVERAVAWAGALKLGNPLDQETTLAPMAHARFAAHVRQQIDAAVAAGATAHLGPDPADDCGAYMGPQILTDVTHDMDVMHEESFGPVVGIMRVDDDDEAVRMMNDSRYGLTARVRIPGMAVAATAIYELAFLNIKAARGVRSHFNADTLFDRVGGAIMAGGAGVQPPQAYHAGKVHRL